MIWLLLAGACAISLVILTFFAARWAFATDRQSTRREDLRAFRDGLGEFLHDPLHYDRKT